MLMNETKMKQLMESKSMHYRNVRNKSETLRHFSTLLYREYKKKTPTPFLEGGKNGGRRENGGRESMKTEFYLTYNLQKTQR